MENRQHTIAVVDDDDTVRDSLRALLETHSYIVVDFADGESFLARGRDNAASCVILDVHMPRLSGLDVLKSLRESGDMVPVILMTGRNDRLLEARAQVESSVTILDKPIPQARLFAAIENALSSSKAHSALSGRQG